MSEEQPTNFKVTDRRLFNSDGSLRDDAPRPEPAPAAPVSQAESVGETGAAAAATRTAAYDQTPESESDVVDAKYLPPDAVADEAADQFRYTDDDDAAAAAYAGGEAAGDYDEAEMEGLDDQDPASFTNFLMSIASNAAAALGLMEHPVTGMRATDLPLAKHWIDTLGMLQQKTRGNLTAQEAQIIEGLLADMRMQYVGLTSNITAPPRGFGGGGGGGGAAGGGGGPRRFSGRDITGGR